ncbi:Ldh family oxidoreductase [Rhodovulum sp. DZ06]|uniref:Ldh family oxidoreductase n=1 Tax=Rhodovulum sp. DZ06 TaxID=3425126 RepID=UPI003D344F1B
MTDPDARSELRLSMAEAEALMARAFAASGASALQAASTARALALAEASGQGGHGMVRTPVYAACVAAGKIDGTAIPTEERTGPGTLRVDAGLGFAYPAWDMALGALPRIAREQGIAIASIVRSNHFGVAGLQAEALAEAGCVALVFGNATACMPPWGGAAPMFGTNPIAFAAPVPGGPPLVIDMATSAVTKGRILAMKAAGETEVPEGWALTRDGRPTTDIDEAVDGLVAPMAGPKGAALAMVVEVMSACLGGGLLACQTSSLLDDVGPPPDLAQTAIAIDPESASGGAYAKKMTELMERFGAVEGARVPGSRRLSARAQAEAKGLAPHPNLVARIRAIAETGADPHA